MQTAIIDTRDMSTLVLCPAHFAEFTQRNPLVLGSQFTLHTDRECQTCACPPTIRNHGEGLASDGGVGASDGGVGASDCGVGASDGGVGVSDGGVGASDGGVGASDGTTPAGRESAESNKVATL